MDKNKLKKKKPDEEELDENEGGEEEEMEKKKSMDLSEDDLERSLGHLENLVDVTDEVSRKQLLLSKAQEGDELTENEQQELFGLLGGERGDDPELDVTKGMQGNETLQKALDVSDYLQEQHTELTKSLDALAEHIESSDNRQHQFNLILAKAVADTGRLVKVIGEELSVIGNQPAYAPKSKGVIPLRKSFAGEHAGAVGPTGDQLSKAEILDGFEGLIQKSVQDGRAGATEDGVDLLSASSQYEQFNSINPRVFKAVVEHIRGKRSA